MNRGSNQPRVSPALAGRFFTTDFPLQFFPYICLFWFQFAFISSVFVVVKLRSLTLVLFFFLIQVFVVKSCPILF